MAASHASLRDDYEVSCPELDVLVELASASRLPRRPPHRRRVRRSTVNLVEAAAVPSFSEAVARAIASRTGRSADSYVFEPSAGARSL